MSMSFYISRDQESSRERGFEYPYERAAILQIAKAFLRKYSNSLSHYAFIANVDSPPIDLLILSEQGLGIADLKNYTGPLSGTDRTEWWFLDEDGNRVKSTRTPSHLNPFYQVKTYRELLRPRLVRFIESARRSLPQLQAQDKFYLQTAIVFTAQKFDLTRLDIDAAHGSWFSLLWLNDVADWAYSLSFGSGYHLTPGQIDLLAERFFCVTPWTEIAGHLDGQETYGYLWMVVDGKEAVPLGLDQEEMTIGRATDIGLSLGADTHPLVSRYHARVRRVPGGVAVGDLGSKHGTYVNRTRLAVGSEYLLRPGDRLTLGTLGTDAEASAGSCQLIFRPCDSDIDPTLSQEIV